MSFSDLLKKPLPSKLSAEAPVTESAEEKVEEVNDMKLEEGTDNNKALTDALDTVSDEGDTTGTPVVEEDSDADDDDRDDMKDLDDIDLSGLSDEELEEMEAELRDSDLDDAAGDDIEPVELTPEEEKEADDLMSLAGTTELIRSELDSDEQDKFFESAIDTQIAVFEGFLLESDILPETSDDEDVLTETKIYGKTTIRKSADAWKAQLYSIAVNVSARAHHDSDFIKLQKVQKMRRILRRKLQKKYHAEAVRRMKVYFNRLKASRSTILSNLGKKIDGAGK
jgi:hypothetical protein